MFHKFYCIDICFCIYLYISNYNPLNLCSISLYVFRTDSLTLNNKLVSLLTFLRWGLILPLSSACWDNRYLSTHVVYAVWHQWHWPRLHSKTLSQSQQQNEFKPRPFWVLGKHSANWATAPVVPTFKGTYFLILSSWNICFGWLCFFFFK